VTAIDDPLDCQYTEVETYQEFGSFLYFGDSDRYFGPQLNLSNFQGGYGNIDGGCKYSFIINNPFSEDLILNITYYVFMPANILHGEKKEEHNRQIEIERYSSAKVNGELGGIGGCSVLEDEISYDITEPYELTLKKGFILKNKTICKQCNGQSCKDDNEKCSFDSECGSGICSIAKYCAKTKVVPCIDGTKNCNDEICLIPSVKKNGEAYSCMWECESGLGNDDKVCKRAPPPWWVWVLFFVIMILIISISIYYSRRSKIDETRKKIMADMKKKQKEIIARTLEEQEGILSSTVHKKEHLESQIDKLTKDIETKNTELKKAKAEKGDLVKTRDDNKVLREHIAVIKRRLERDKENLEETRKKLEEERLTPYLNKQGHKVIRNEDGYEIFPDSRNLFHLWWWKIHHGPVKWGYQIHHKNRKKLDNRIENLEEIEKEEHEEMHGRRK